MPLQGLVSFPLGKLPNFFKSDFVGYVLSCLDMFGAGHVELFALCKQGEC